MGENSEKPTESSTEIVFKKPDLSIVPRKKRKSVQEKVLDEDTYIEKIGEIIERDFFPDLEQLKVHSDYLDAVQKKDFTRIQELHRKYTQTPQIRLASPATFETPKIHENLQEKEGKETTTEKPCIRGSNLDSFLAEHTSQDNQSFVEMLEESDKKHREKFHFLYNEETSSLEAKKAQLAVPSIQEQCALPVRPFNVDTWTYKNYNSVMFTPDGVVPERPIEEQEISHRNTRFSEGPPRALVPESCGVQHPALGRTGKIGVDGKEIVPATPRRRGYDLVATPSPDLLGTPLMTWGEIEGTPLRLVNEGTPQSRTRTPSFRMVAPSPREQLAHSLVDRAKKKKAQKIAQGASTTNASTSFQGRLAAMSPSARRLATRSLRLEYSEKTPKKAADVGVFTGPSTPLKPREDLTNDLLKIELPKRQKASDFF